MGIFFSLFAAVFVMPSIIILGENLEHWLTKSRHARLSTKMNALRKR